MDIDICIECADDGYNIVWIDGHIVSKCDSCPYREEAEDAKQ